MSEGDDGVSRETIIHPGEGRKKDRSKEYSNTQRPEGLKPVFYTHMQLKSLESVQYIQNFTPKNSLAYSY